MYYVCFREQRSSLLAGAAGKQDVDVRDRPLGAIGRGRGTGEYAPPETGGVEAVRDLGERECHGG
jgi:hypothetical protein